MATTNETNGKPFALGNKPRSEWAIATTRHLNSDNGKTMAAEGFVVSGWTCGFCWEMECKNDPNYTYLLNSERDGFGGLDNRPCENDVDGILASMDLHRCYVVRCRLDGDNGTIAEDVLGHWMPLGVAIKLVQTLTAKK